MLKRILLSMAVVASAVAGATILDLEGVNKAITEILAAYNNETTEATVKFTALEVDEVLTQNFGVYAKYGKTGSQNFLELAIPALDYRYKGDDGQPTMNGILTLKLDLVKAFGHKTLNDLAEGAEGFVKDFLEGFTAEYGDAATTDAAVDLLERDADGNVTHLKMHVAGAIDLGKLPEGKNPEGEFVVKGRGALDIGLSDEKLELKLIFNPGYKGFKSEERGLKEFIEQLQSGNKDAYNEVAQYVDMVNGFAERVVEQKAAE